MPRSTAEIHHGLRVRLDSIITATMRADPDAAAGLTADQRRGIDRHSLDFLRGSRRTVLEASFYGRLMACVCFACCAYCE